MMSTVLSVSGELKFWHQSPYAMTLVSWTHVEARGLCHCVKMDRAPLAGTYET